MALLLGTHALDLFVNSLTGTPGNDEALAVLGGADRLDKQVLSLCRGRVGLLGSATRR
jgi:hypothetical protein